MSRANYTDREGQTIPSKGYVLITVEENNALKKKNDNLIQRIRNSWVIINDAEAFVDKRNREYLNSQEWLTYLANEKVPKPFQPEAIRQYFSNTSILEERDVESTVNWIVTADERSILNQNIDAVNLTRRFLKKSKTDFGKQYDIRVKDAMEISRRIQNVLENSTDNLSERIIQDIKVMKFYAYKQIKAYIDNLSFRVLCSEDAYMDSIDEITAEYSYKAQNFDIHIWTFKNVPIYLDPQDTPFKEVNFHQTKNDLLVPISGICRNMVIRCLHCHFDHFSIHARNSELQDTDSPKQNLMTCLEMEWEIEKKIQCDVKAHMIQQRADFERAMRLQAEEEELKAKQRKLEAKNGSSTPKQTEKVTKPKKSLKEPPIVTADLVPLVRTDFLTHDILQHEAFMMKFHPDSFGLKTGEINLRKYQILGGVYQINYLSKPRITTQHKHIMSWYKVNKKIEYQNAQIKIDIKESQNVEKFFKITFELPDCLCNWGEPLPCLFEEGTLYHDQFDDPCRTIKALNVRSPIIINDFNLYQLFNKLMMYEFIETSIPRVISSFRLPDDFNDDDEDKKTKSVFMRTKQKTEDDLERERKRIKEREELSFEAQNFPERLFPIFKKVLPVVILPLEDGNGGKLRTHTYEKFSEFFAALESIKSSYQMSKFKDNLGSPIKILAEKYEKGIVKPNRNKITGKLVTEAEKFDEKLSFELNNGPVESLESLQIETMPEKSKQRPDATKSKNITKSKRDIKNKPEEVIAGREGLKKEPEGPTEFSKWSTANIFKKEFNAISKKITIWTDRLGTFGFAFYRYQHFPFQSWSIQPNKNNPLEVEFVIESMFAVFRIYVTPEGYKASITDFAKYSKNRKIYLEIVEPIVDVKYLKERLQQKHLNIFPERDASWYLTGYFSEKHEAVENHTYNCISLYATSLKYICSFWNKLSNRRTMVLKFGELRDAEEDQFLIRITPEDVMFVEIKEACTDLETIQLEYTPTWRNLEWYADLNHLITSTYGGADDMRVKDPTTVCYLKDLLQAVRPLSCS